MAITGWNVHRDSSLEGRGRNRLAEQPALCVLHAVGQEEGCLLLGLHPFGDHVEAKRPRASPMMAVTTSDAEPDLTMDATKRLSIFSRSTSRESSSARLE